MAARTQVAMIVSHEEKALLEAAAAREGVSISVFMFRRVFNQPDANRTIGRPKKKTGEQPPAAPAEGLFNIAV